MYRAAEDSDQENEEASAPSEKERAKGASKVEESTRGFVVGRGTSLVLDVCTSSTKKPVSPFSSAPSSSPGMHEHPRESIELAFT